MKRVAAAMLAVAIVSSPGLAQSDSLSLGRREPRQVLSFQPIQAIAGLLSADYERAIGGGMTLGVGTSYWDSSTLGIGDDVLDAHYFSAEVKARYYPGERPFRGVSLGLTAGGARASFSDVYDDHLKASGAKVGVELDYNWLVSRSDRMAIALGVGGKRVFFGANGERLTGAYPTSRIAIGWAF